MTSTTRTLWTGSLLNVLTVTLLFLVFSGCSENPVTDDGHVDSFDELEVRLDLSSDHVHTLSTVSFDVEVSDHHGNIFSDFEQVSVEYLREGTDTWRAIDLQQNGSMFSGDYMFMSSGTYELRVSGMLHDMSEMGIMHHAPEHLEVGRAHVNIGDYRIEFETYPGHIHEGDDVSMQFFVLDGTSDQRPRPSISGLSTTIQCEESDGSSESHSASEVQPGTYEALHLFSTAGEAHVGIQFTAPGGAPVEADFHFPVVHGH